MKDVPITVYISIGNSDNRLSQSRWAAFASNVIVTVRRHAMRLHGEWYSLPNSAYQNACFCADFRDADKAEHVKMRLGEIRRDFDQAAVAWVVAETEFV